MIWGTISDYFGRRPTTAACLLVLSLSCIGLALVPTSAYWLLLVLRCLQAAGSASTIAIGMIYFYLIRSLLNLNICNRCWCDWRYIQSCRTRWILWSFHAWSFGALKRKEFSVYRCSLTNFNIGGPSDSSGNRRRTVRLIGLEVYHFVSLIYTEHENYFFLDPYFGFCVSHRRFVS